MTKIKGIKKTHFPSIRNECPVIPFLTGPTLALSVSAPPNARTLSMDPHEAFYFARSALYGPILIHIRANFDDILLEKGKGL